MEFSYIDSLFNSTSNMQTTNTYNNIRLKEGGIPKGYVYEINETYFGPFSYPESDIKVCAKIFLFNF